MNKLLEDVEGPGILDDASCQRGRVEERGQPSTPHFLQIDETLIHLKLPINCSEVSLQSHGIGWIYVVKIHTVATW